MKINKFGKIVISIILGALAGVRWVFHDIAVERMDTTFFGLVILAILIFIFPWENIKTFKAGGIELSLEQPVVKAAISGLGLNRINDEKLKEQLLKLEEEIQVVRGGRVLWIDDKPHNIIGERRLLRSLGIQIVPATSSELAEEILDGDNDFDLIISDVQRKGGSYKLNRGVKIHEGVNFIVKLRQHEDTIIQVMPVVFYAAYDWERLVEFTRPARELQPEPEISNSVIDFVPKVIKQLAKSRATVISYSNSKDPTPIRWQN
jgi:CheY-like chemotaxis protein